jgi:hypothetical protein
MVMDPRAALAALRRHGADGSLDAFCAARGVRLLTVLGSVLDETEPAPADLDLAVLLDDDADLLAVLTDLIRLLRFDGIDLMDLRSAGLVAKAAALEGEPLFEDAPGRYARLQMATLPLAAETAWIRRLQLEQLRT